jgi:hypothetical protein
MPCSQYDFVIDRSAGEGMRYHFDCLPLHPPPESLESLTSYLIRLAQINGILSIDGLSALCFPQQDRRIPRGLADYPPLSFSTLQTITICPEPALRATTFHHLVVKFGRSSHPQPVSRFLSGSLATSLRYCPLCLDERLYYRLAWRFPMVEGCAEHRYRLLDHCGFCYQAIPLFAAPLKIGVCPSCKNELRACSSEPLTEESWQQVYRQATVIQFLLRPRPWEQSGKQVVKLLGKLLSSRRREMLLTAPEAANQLGISLSRVEGMERGNTLGRGATLHNYVNYADLLHVSLQEAFLHILPQTKTAP